MQIGSELFAIFVLIVSILNIIYASVAWAQADGKPVPSGFEKYVSSYSIWYIFLSIFGLVFAGLEAKKFLETNAI
jgi:hypothetical protein